MKKALLTALIAFAILNFGYLLGYNAGKYHQRKSEHKIDWPEEPVGLGATIEHPDTVLMFQYPKDDTIRVYYYRAGERLSDCNAENYPF